MAGISKEERARRAAARAALEQAPAQASTVSTVDNPFSGAVPQPDVQAGTAAMRACDRENPAKLSGEPLRRLAHQLGIAKSELARMDDEKVRLQIRTISRFHPRYSMD